MIPAGSYAIHFAAGEGTGAMAAATTTASLVFNAAAEGATLTLTAIWE